MILTAHTVSAKLWNQKTRDWSPGSPTDLAGGLRHITFLLRASVSTSGKQIHWMATITNNWKARVEPSLGVQHCSGIVMCHWASPSGQKGFFLSLPLPQLLRVLPAVSPVQGLLWAEPSRPAPGCAPFWKAACIQCRGSKDLLSHLSLGDLKVMSAAEHLVVGWGLCGDCPAAQHLPLPNPAAFLSP